jgi:hypothetical protein
MAQMQAELSRLTGQQLPSNPGASPLIATVEPVVVVPANGEIYSSPATTGASSTADLESLLPPRPTVEYAEDGTTIIGGVPLVKAAPLPNTVSVPDKNDPAERSARSQSTKAPKAGGFEDKPR